MRWWGIEMFVGDSIRSQLFEPADFEESYHPFVHPVASHSYRDIITFTMNLLFEVT